MTEFVALVPARLASVRLPNKPLLDIGGIPMVIRVARRAAQSGASRVVIATDSPDIVAVALEHGVDALLTRADHPSGTDRLAEAAMALGLPDDRIVVNVQGDEPLIPPDLVARVARLLEESPDCSIATAAHPMHTIDEYLNPNFVKVVTDARDRAAYFSRAPIPFDRDLLSVPGSRPAELSAAMAADPPLRHVGLYAYRTGFLRAYPEMPRAPTEVLESLEQLRALWHGHRIVVMRLPDAPPGGVDTPEDLARVRQLLAANG